MNLVPRPVTWEARPGSYALGSDNRVCVHGDASARRVAEAFGRELREQLGLDLGAVGEESSGGRRATPDSSGPAILFELDENVETEEGGYLLSVEPDRIHVRAPASVGLFYGGQTILQLASAGGSSIPCARVRDFPRYQWRGMHLDVARHFFPVSFVKRYLDLLARHKFNVFHWHLTEDQGWRIPVPDYPKLAEISAWRTPSDASSPYGGYYTREEIQEVVDYAAERFITVVPEIEMPGHALAALAAYPDLSCAGGPFEVETEWGIFDDVFCAGKEETFEFLERVLAEVVKLFPGSYVHVGGDECPKTRWSSCARCQERMRVEGLADESELQSWFMGRISGVLQKHGKRLIGWDEILEGGLISDATVMSWRGFEGGVSAARLGNDVVMTPTDHCYFDYKQSPEAEEPGAIGVTPLAQVYAFEPTPPELSEEEATHVLGGQGNVWTERMVDVERVDFMVIPRVCALSETLWSPSSVRDWNDFCRRLPTHLDGLRRLGYGHRPVNEVGR